MSEHPLRVGLVGANAERSWAKVAHLPALRTLPEFTLTAVATRRLASAEVAAQAFGAMEAYDDFHQLVRSNNVDIVTVCVRVPFHLDVVMAALEAGKHVMCEWPLGRDIGEAEKMAEAARTAGVRTCIGLQGRMALAAQRAREMLSTGAIGRPLTASIYVPNTHGGPRVPAHLAYLMDPANGATMTTITGGHNIDLAQFVLGSVRELAAWGTIMFPDVELVDPPGHVRRETPDRLLIQILHENGCVTGLEIAGNRPPGSLFTFRNFHARMLCHRFWSTLGRLRRPAAINSRLFSPWRAGFSGASPNRDCKACNPDVTRNMGEGMICQYRAEVLKRPTP